MADRLRVALAARAVLASCAAAAAVESPAQTTPRISVKIGSSGSSSETRRTVPIARSPGGGSRVAMS